MRNLINVRCWSRLTYLNILSYRNLWDTRTLGTLTIIFVNIPPGFLCHRRHYRHYTRALTPSDTLHGHREMRPCIVWILQTQRKMHVTWREWGLLLSRPQCPMKWARFGLEAMTPKVYSRCIRLQKNECRNLDFQSIFTCIGRMLVACIHSAWLGQINILKPTKDRKISEQRFKQILDWPSSYLLIGWQECGLWRFLTRPPSA